MKIMKILKSIFLINCIYIFGKYIYLGKYAMSLMGLAAILFLFVPKLFEKVFKIQVSMSLEKFYLIFTFFAFNLGTGLRWYDRYSGLDNIVHFASGIFFTLIGFMFFEKLSSIHKDSKPFFKATYAVFFSSFIAVCWEIWEFTSYLITGHDSQNHLTTGVFDTMEDLIACMLGSILIAAVYLFYIKRDKNKFNK